MKFLGTRVIGDNTDSEYIVADVVSDGAILPHSVNVDEYITNLLKQIDALKTELKSADEGLKLFHSIASNGEQSVLSRLDGKVDEVDAQRWQDEQIELAGRSDESGGESVYVSQYFNGYKATATASWRERHLNGGN